MTAVAAAARGRALAERQMTSTCTIRGRSAGNVTDPSTGEVTDTPGGVVYSGKCRVRPAGRVSRLTEAGGAELFEFDYLASIPFTETAVIEGHRLTVTGSADASLVGVELEVQKVDRGDHISARRLACTEVK